MVAAKPTPATASRTPIVTISGAYLIRGPRSSTGDASLSPSVFAMSLYQLGTSKSASAIYDGDLPQLQPHHIVRAWQEEGSHQDPRPISCDETPCAAHFHRVGR